MGKFGKALRQIEATSGGESISNVSPHPADGRQSLRERFSLGVQLEYLRTRWRWQPQEAAQAVFETLPPGEVQSTPLGSHYVIRGVFPQDYFHGKVRLNRFSSSDLESCMDMMRETGAVPDRDRIVFLDTETTGVQGSAGICPFLVGLGYFSGDEFHMLQYFIRDFDEEPSMLYALGELLERFSMVITYNGRAFDLPLLEARFTLSRLENPFKDKSHLDLLFSARRLWRNGHGSCRLIALEQQMISFMRGPDVPGAMIPRAYFDYLQRRPNPTLRNVFSHNVHDVVSLAALTIHACDRVNLEPAPLDDPLDLYSLARILQNSRSWRRCIQLYEMALAGGVPEPERRRALENLSVAYRRAGDHERSRETCDELMAHSEFSMAGYEGAAIHCERITHDFERAIYILEEGFQRAESKRWKMLLKARCDRLRQKVMVWQ
jgi:uncharacterized protein YprB with RNaseH-like and TPR domain